MMKLLTGGMKKYQAASPLRVAQVMPGPQAEEEGREDHGREERQVGKARRQDVVQGEAQAEGEGRRGQGGALAQPRARAQALRRMHDLPASPPGGVCR